MTKRFEKAYNALYEAFMNETLAKGTCIACAVGNIIAKSQGARILKEIKYSSDGEISDIDFCCTDYNSFWSSLLCCTADDSDRLEKRVKDLTNYTWDEMSQVERAFERNTKIDVDDYINHSEAAILNDQFNGLMTAMDVLIELDNIEEGEQKKAKFKNKFQPA